MKLQELLQFTLDKKASDLHVSAGIAPMIRVDGELIHIENENPLTAQSIAKFCQEIMNDQQQDEFKGNWEIDFSYSLPNGEARFRVNAFQQQRGPSIAFRPISSTAPTLKELEMPAVIEKLCGLPNGLILMTGPTGSGKSTTLAAMVEHINTSTQKHIITIEDPIEFIHTPKKCLINQREVHHDTKSFRNALRSALREDPDIILVGEMRDLETIRLALSAAETGHLVLATLHTSSAAKTINRVIDVFPAGEKEMVRSMLSESLRSVLAQTLIKRTQGGRVAAMEILISTPAVRNLIREDKIPQIYSAIQAGQSHGMQTLEHHLRQLAEKKVINPPDMERPKD